MNPRENSTRLVVGGGEEADPLGEVVVNIYGELRRCAVETCRKKLAMSNKGDLCYGCAAKESANRLRAQGIGRNGTPTGATRFLSPDGPRRSKAPRPKPKTEACTVELPRAHTNHLPDLQEAAAAGQDDFVMVEAKALQNLVDAAQEKGAPKVDDFRKPETGATAGDPEPERKEMAAEMDKLVARVVKKAEIPKPEHKIMGRTGEAWLALKALGPDECLEIQNRSADHAQNTSGHLKLIAKRAGRTIKTERRGTKLFVWLEEEKK